MSYVQIIDKVTLPGQVWLSLWELEKKVRLSIEIVDPQMSYGMGELFFLDRGERSEVLALKPIRGSDVPKRLTPLIPVPSAAPADRAVSADRGVMTGIIEKVQLAKMAGDS